MDRVAAWLVGSTLAEPTKLSPSVTATCKETNGAGTWMSVRVTVNASAAVAVNACSDGCATVGKPISFVSSNSTSARADPARSVAMPATDNSNLSSTLRMSHLRPWRCISGRQFDKFLQSRFCLVHSREILARLQRAAKAVSRRVGLAGRGLCHSEMVERNRGVGHL